MEIFKETKNVVNVFLKKLNVFTKNIYFEDIANEWLKSKKVELKESSYYNYMYKVDKYLMPTFEKFKLKDLKTYDYNNFIEELTEDYAIKTIRDIVNVLKPILKYCEKEYKCSINENKIKLPKLQSKMLKVLNKKEKRKLTNYCIEENSLKSIGILLCLNTGLRIGEICSLRWENIDLEAKIINVKKTLQRVYIRKDKRTKIIIGPPKTSTSIRSIPISNKLYNILQPLKKKYKSDNFFLTGSSDKFMEPRTYQNIYKKILKKSKVKNYKFHILRHTFATDCVQVGMDIKSLSEILGHSDVNMTLNIYVHSSYKMKKKFLEKL